MNKYVPYWNLIYKTHFVHYFVWASWATAAKQSQLNTTLNAIVHHSLDVMERNGEEAVSILSEAF